MATQLPLIDISQINESAADKLVETISKYGFVYVKNTGLDLPATEIDDMFDLATRFFDCSTEEKIRYAVNSRISGKNSGWLGMNAEKLDTKKQKLGDFKEAFNINEFVDGKAQQPLPDILHKNEQAIDDFINKCRSICLQLLRLFALGLKIEESDGGADFFLPHHDSKVGPSGSVFRMLYYPALAAEQVPSPNEARCGAHSDYGTITLLFQRDGQAGLEILTDATTDTWASVPVNPTSEKNVPILVNVGDLLSYWTNGALKSAVHRVTAPIEGSCEARKSIAYFCHPIDNAKLEVVPSKMVHDFGSKINVDYTVLTAKQHLESRLSATY